MASLSALDLLDLSDTEQLVVQCLTRRPSQSVAELAQAIPLAQGELTRVIDQMVSAARLVRENGPDQPRFSVSFTLERKQARPKASSLLDLFD
jgi:DNA-binding MarR family transcriptional regulator